MSPVTRHVRLVGGPQTIHGSVIGGPKIIASDPINARPGWHVGGPVDCRLSMGLIFTF